jgi:hypothetical protein
MRRCPRCALLSPDTAAQCDCGHSFVTGVLDAPPDGPRRRGKAMTTAAWLRRGALIAVVLLTCGVAIRRACTAVRDGMCANQVLQEVRSPSGKNKVVVFQRDCGATTGFSTQASILPSTEALPHAAGNVFVADDGHGAAPAGAGGGPALRARWLDDQRLVLSHHAAARIFESKRLHQGITIVVEKLQ